jgi:type II secretory pathway component HofQ
VLPAINLVAFQNKQNTKLLASTQIHAFNNEDSSARIGQRVPVRTATISNGIQQSGTKPAAATTMAAVFRATLSITNKSV